MKRLVFIAFLVAITSSAAAQNTGEDFRARQQNLTTLSKIFGEMHHIRRMCEPRREADVWRNRMKKLVELEDPAASQREVMVGAFNDGYRAAQKRYDQCDRNAEDYAAARAAEGETIVTSLTAPLYESLEESEDFPTVWRGSVNQ